MSDKQVPLLVLERALWALENGDISGAWTILNDAIEQSAPRAIRCFCEYCGEGFEWSEDLAAHKTLHYYGLLPTLEDGSLDAAA